MTMTLKILLPSEVFLDQAGITRIVAESRQGSFGLLPARLDCVAALAPGILTYQAAHGEISVAVDAGVLVKVGPNVLVSVRRAASGSDLSKLHEAVEQQFLTLGVQEKAFARRWRRWKAAFCAASPSLSRNVGNDHA